LRAAVFIRINRTPGYVAPLRQGTVLTGMVSSTQPAELFVPITEALPGTAATPSVIGPRGRRIWWRVDAVFANAFTISTQERV
jgi:hypothetical protein